MNPLGPQRGFAAMAQAPLPERRGGKASFECVVLGQPGEIGIELITTVAIVVIEP
jgi:hypothetical protein